MRVRSIACLAVWFLFVLICTSAPLAAEQILNSSSNTKALWAFHPASLIMEQQKSASSDTSKDNQSKVPAKAASAKPSGGQSDSLVTQGKSRFQAYKCYDCHGKNGEGTDDAPSLTHSKLTAEQVSKFLQKPSVDAQNKGMPDIPLDSPDHKPLVAYVMSLRAK